MEEKTRFKASHYNHFVPTEDGKRLAFNAMSCGLAEMDEESYQVYEALAGGDGDGVDRQKHAELIENLKKGGFLIDPDLDELAAIRAAHYRARFGNRGFGLTIIPTLRCNFACDYCYEDSKIHSTPDDRGGLMSDEVCDNIVKLCEQRIEPKGTFGVTWYGGEPLLAPQIIEKLTKEFIRICEEKEASYHAGIITNGYLLDEKNLELLKRCKVTFAQVTIDGPREVHDKRRCLKSGGGTYDRIMENLLRIPEDSGLRIAIRINVDKRNEQGVPTLLRQMRHIGLHQREHVSINFGHITHYRHSCQDIASTCMNSADFSQFMVWAYDGAVRDGFRLTTYPRPMITSCGAVGCNSALIEPEGDVHSCWNTIGEKHKRSGKLDASGIHSTNQCVQWQAWSPFREACRVCNVLPLCMGGCPYKTIHKQDVTDSEATVCLWWKYNLRDMMSIMKHAQSVGLLSADGAARSARRTIVAEGMDSL